MQTLFQLSQRSPEALPVTKQECVRKPSEKLRLSCLDGRPIIQAFGTGGFAEKALIYENRRTVVNNKVKWGEAECIGCVTMKQCRDMLGVDGTAYCIDLFKPDVTIDLEVNPADLLVHQRGFKGVWMVRLT